MEKLVNWDYGCFRDYGCFQKDPKVDLIYNGGLSGIKGIDPSWKDYALVTLSHEPSGYYVPVRGYDNDLFYFNYNFLRPFTIEDYRALKKKHNHILIGIHYTSIHLPPRLKYWNHNSADNLSISANNTSNRSLGSIIESYPSSNQSPKVL